jgi:hypothetical protein
VAEIAAVRPGDLLTRADQADALRSTVPTYIVDGDLDDRS